jgi:hypothetical protein
LPFFRFASAVAIAAATTLVACGGTDQSPGSTSTSTCAITLAASTDDAHLQTAIENALRRQNPCGLPDTAVRTPAARSAGARAELRTAYELVRVERDQESVRAVFQAVPEMRLANTGE